MTAALTHDPREVLAADGALPVPEACRFLGLSRSSLYREMRAGRIAWTKCAGRTLILRASARAYLAAGIGAPLDAPPTAQG